MDLITNNPYRILGLLVGATATQFNRHIKRIPMYIDAGETIPDEFTENSFKCLGRIERTKSSISLASAKLNLNNDKIDAALFWFYTDNSKSDSDAFNFLKDGQIVEADSIWRELTKYDIDEKNASAFHNLSILSLLYVFVRKSINQNYLEYTLRLQLKFLDSVFVNKFIITATETNYSPSKNELQLLFLKQILLEVDRRKEFDNSIFFEIIENLEFSAKEEFNNNYTQGLIQDIENKLNEIRIKLRNNLASAISLGEELFIQTSNALTQIKSILGASDIRFELISDKVSNEILQCGVEYFSHMTPSNLEFVEKTMAIYINASKLAIGNFAKQKCQVQISELNRFTNYLTIKYEYNALLKLISTYEIYLIGSTDNAIDLIDQSKQLLYKIKSVVGNNDDLYIQLSSQVAELALSDLNNKPKSIISYFNSSKRGKKSIKDSLNSLKKLLKLIEEIEMFDITDNIRIDLNNNKKIFEESIIYFSNIKPTSNFKLFIIFLKETPNWLRWVLGILIVLGILVGIIYLFFGLEPLISIANFFGFIFGWIFLSFLYTRRIRYTRK